MARAEIDYVVQTVSPVTGRMSAGAGYTVTVKARNADGTSGSDATVYTTPNLGTTATNPITTDSSGRINGWLDQGIYNLVVSGVDIITYTQPFDAVPGTGITPTLVDGSVTTTKIADLNVTSGKIANNAVTSTQLSSDGATDANRAVQTNHIRDNAIATAKIADGAVTNAKRAIVSTVRVTHSTTQTRAASGTLSIAFDTERWDTDTMHDNVTNNSRITFTTAGVYSVSASIDITSPQIGDIVAIRLNGTTKIAQSMCTAAQEWATTLSTIYNFAATDYVELILTTTATAGTRTVTQSGNFTPEFMANYIGRAS